jgi:hypothetical protein
MYVVERIRETAVATPTKVAMVFNGAPLTYGSFWRLIDGWAQTLRPHLPEPGIALLWVDSLLESWILDLALRSLGHDTASLRDEEQIGLFAGLKVACLITLNSERTYANRNPGLRHLAVSDPSKMLHSLDLRSPLPTLAVSDKPAGHISLTSGTTGLYKKVRGEFGTVPEPIEKRLARYAELGDEVRQQDASTVCYNFNMS